MIDTTKFVNKLYYGPKNTTNNKYRISPVPKITINRQINYANDVIIGYTYTIDINGFASTFRDLRDNSSQQISTDISGNNNIQKVFDNIEIVRQILSKNGSFLRLIDQNNNVLLEAKGGTLRSLNFADSDNQWTQYCQYTAQIEFNELNILNENPQSAIDSTSITSNIIDITKYKIKTFTDSWTFDVQNETYNSFVINGETGQTLNINNSTINVSYNLSATGKNYYQDDGTTKAAWIQAKEFVQDRLYRQVKSLIGGALAYNADFPDQQCEANKKLGALSYDVLSSNDSSQIDHIDNTNNDGGIFKSLQNNYKVYNETVSCDTSESEGTFSINYASILKQKSSGSFDADNVLHKVTKNVNFTIDNAIKKNTTISVNGTIEGLIEGGLIRTGGKFTLPQNGVLMFASDGVTKYQSIIDFLPKIFDLDNDDLISNFKTALNINYLSLGMSTDPDILLTNQLSDPFLSNAYPPDCLANQSTLRPISFNLTKNYLNSTIEYSVEYTSKRGGSGDKNSYVTITTYSVDEPVSVLAEFNIPGSTFYNRDGYTVIQDINTVTARKIAVTIEGRNKQYRVCGECDLDLLYIANYGLPIPELPDNKLPSLTDYILTERQTSYNVREGSYTVTLGYMCKQGCNI